MKKIPRHLALIPDGNRRWARQRNLPVFAGHKKVLTDIFPKLVEKSFRDGVEVFTIWLFSTENWQREKNEVDALLELGNSYLDILGKKLSKNSIRIKMIGRRDNVPQSLMEKIEKWEKLTAENKKAILVLAFNYGGQDEILRAVKRISSEKNATKIENLTSADFAQYLDTVDLPDPDLVIRTSGEIRTSGFLPWQSSYSEWYFSDLLMPDFDEVALQNAFDEFSQRQRRFGE